jgi:hypothetical protein
VDVDDDVADDGVDAIWEWLRLTGGSKSGITNQCLIVLDSRLTRI